MFNKRLIAMMGDSKRYIARNVALQWLALLANIAMIFAVSAFLAGLVAGQGNLPAALLVLLGALIVRFFCTQGAASASYNASRTVKKTLRAAIYEKLLRLGGSYTQTVPTAEVLQLAGEGVEQLETYFGAYLRAADPRFHRSGTEICQAAAGQILGAVRRTGRQLPRKPARSDDAQNLSGRRGPPRGHEP